ncbi:MAG: alpha/beta hydrolase-fold protein [Clostridia bacterium]
MKKIILVLMAMMLLLTSCQKSEDNVESESQVTNDVSSSQIDVSSEISSEVPSSEVPKSTTEETSSKADSSHESSSAVKKQSSSKPNDNTLTSKTAEFNYLEFMPKNYKEGTSYPLVIYLHGSGERGTDINTVANISLPKFAKNGKKYPFYLIAPQINENEEWRFQIDKLNKFLDYLIEHYNVNKNQIYLTGNSLGGIGSWYWAEESGERFAAVVPVCGYGDLDKADKLVDIPIWAFHGARDKAVDPNSTIDMVNKINSLGGNAKKTIYKNVQHNAWDYAYKDEKLFDWLLAQKKQ